MTVCGLAEAGHLLGCDSAFGLGERDKIVQTADVGLTRLVDQLGHRVHAAIIRRAKERKRDYTIDWVHLKLDDQAQCTVACNDPFRSHDERVERLGPDRQPEVCEMHTRKIRGVLGNGVCFETADGRYDGVIFWIWNATAVLTTFERLCWPVHR